MFVIVDIDCTLYSYREFISAQGFNLSSLMNALTYKDMDKMYDDIEKAWRKYSQHIEDRLKMLVDTFSVENIIIYSAFPITTYKKQSLEKFGLRSVSSSPRKKSSEEIKSYSQGVDLVIGDRSSDKSLARELQAEWRGYPYCSPSQWVAHVNYTKAFSRLLEKN